MRSEAVKSRYSEVKKNEGLDGSKKTLHNLISLVLTNKTIRSEAKNCKVERLEKNTDL